VRELVVNESLELGEIRRANDLISHLQDESGDSHDGLAEQKKAESDFAVIFEGERPDSD
jgi:hypothetical protein